MRNSVKTLGVDAAKEKQLKKNSSITKNKKNEKNQREVVGVLPSVFGFATQSKLLANPFSLGSS